jgi:hypothetical protein
MPSNSEPAQPGNNALMELTRSPYVPVIVPNMRVCDVEDRCLGTVIDVMPSKFLVETSDASIWMSYEAVFRTEGIRVILLCASGGLTRYRVEPDC